MDQERKSAVFARTSDGFDLEEGTIDPLAAITAHEWAEASCRDETGSLSRLFFSEETPDILRAKQICAGCELLGPCLDGALQRREPWGVWGGELFLNGRILPQKRRRGRPPKNPPPHLPLSA